MTLRLSLQLQQVGFEEMELKVQKDLRQLQEWSIRFEQFAAQQGKLDLKWINDRFSKGKIAVDEMMGSLQSYVALSSLNLAMADIVGTQQKYGSNTLLSQISVAKKDVMMLTQKVLEGLANRTNRVHGQRAKHSRDLWFNEWGYATWLLQQDKMKGHDIPHYHFMSYIVDDDKLAEKLRTDMSGKIFKDTDWWDTSDRAGPKQRPGAAWEEAVPELEALTIEDNKAKFHVCIKMCFALDLITSYHSIHA
eukprot:s1296_g17.t1